MTALNTCKSSTPPNADMSAICNMNSETSASAKPMFLSAFMPKSLNYFALRILYTEKPNLTKVYSAETYMR